MINILERIKNMYNKYLSVYVSFASEFEKEQLLHSKIAKIIINSSDPEELKNKIVKEVALSLGASRCFIVEYDSDTNNFKKIMNSYNQKREDLSVLGFDVESNLPNLALKQKYMKFYIIEDTDKFIKSNKLEGSSEEFYLRKYNVEASAIVRLEFGEVFLGVLVVHYDRKKPFLKKFDIEFLKNIAEHISIALHLSVLYKNEKEEKERERLLRSIISVMRADCDLDLIIRKTCEILSAIYKIKDIYIYFEINDFKNRYIYDSPTFEFRKITDENLLPIFEVFKSKEFDSRRKKYSYIKDTHKFIVQKNLENTPIEKYFLDNNIKSVMFLPILHEYLSFGLITIQFDKTDIIDAENFDFIKTVAEQLSIAIQQSYLNDLNKKKAEREALLRKITEKIRSSLNLDEILTFICEETANLFKVQRVAIATYEDVKNYKSFKLQKEYKTNTEINSFFEIDDVSNVLPFLEEKLLNKGAIWAVDNVLEEDAPQEFKEAYSSLGVKSLLGSSISKEDKVWGSIVLSEYQKTRHWSEEEINILKTISDQVYIAINQAELFKETKNQLEKERLVANILSSSMVTFDLNNIRKIVDVIGKMTKADRCYFVEVDLENFKGKPIEYDGEYLSSPKIKSIIGYEFSTDDVRSFIEVYNQEKSLVFFDYEKILQAAEDRTKGMANYISQFDLRCGIGIPIFYKDELRAVLAIEYVNQNVKLPEKELDFLRLVGNQVSMVYNQIRLYQNTKLKAERESFLRQVFESMRSSLDINIVKNEIVTAVGKALNADRCFILEYNKEDFTYFLLDNEYVSSKYIKPYLGVDINKELPVLIQEFKKGKTLLLDKNGFSLDGEYFDMNDEKYYAEKAATENYKITSALVFPLYYSEEFFGNLVLHYVNKKYYVAEDDINLIKIFSEQIAIALYQATLYKKIQMQAEREKISRNIIEILRSSIDKVIIKKLFVKNIGKFFNADRVFFAEYDESTKMYLPVDENSEYLSSSDVLSFIGYDWSNPKASEYIYPLLEKRELIIYNWEEYIHKNVKSQDFIELFEDSNVKSSYSFPVLYQQNIIGFFCIEFTNNVKRLSEDEINRIRSICTQAGIAMHHAALYTQAQECMIKKDSLSLELLEKIEKPAQKILELSNLLIDNEFEREAQIIYLNNIINSCKNLLDLTNSASHPYNN